jgi:hypothetical protein
MPGAPTPPALLNAQASNAELLAAWAIQDHLEHFPKRWHRLFVRKCVIERKLD